MTAQALRAAFWFEMFFLAWVIIMAILATFASTFSWQSWLSAAISVVAALFWMACPVDPHAETSVAIGDVEA